MNRRGSILALIAIGAAPFASAQPAGKVWRIGFLGATSLAGYGSRLETFRAGMRDFGYVEGKNLAFEYRWAEGKYERLHELAAELVRLKVDLILTHGTPGTLAAMKATATIPIVVGIVGDPVAAGIVTSIARPDKNLTGLTYFSPELAAKRLDFLREVLPRMQRCAVLVNPDNPVNGPTLQTMAATAKTLRLELQIVEIRRPEQFEAEFSKMVQKRAEGVVAIEDGMLIGNVKTIAALAAKVRLPSIGPTELADAGGLIAYGVNIPAMFRRAAYYADRLFKGAKVADLPIERATTFELIINRKTARGLGVTIPPPLLLRADRVIE